MADSNGGILGLTKMPNGDPEHSHKWGVREPWRFMGDAIVQHPVTGQPMSAGAICVQLEACSCGALVAKKRVIPEIDG